MLSTKEQQLLDALEPLAADNNVEIVTIEIVGGKKSPTIRVYIDTENGVGFDELTAAQSWINDEMDRINPFPGAYTLEVSSPGIDRPLRTLEHFQAQCGQTVMVKIQGKINGRGVFKGMLAEVGTLDADGADAENADEPQESPFIVVQCDGEGYRIPLERIAKANVIGVIDFSRKDADI